jgi:hypothetical protein
MRTRKTPGKRDEVGRIAGGALENSFVGWLARGEGAIVEA